MKAKDIAQLSATELAKSQLKVKKDLLDLRFEHALGKLTDTSVLAKTRKSLARIETRLSALKEGI